MFRITEDILSGSLVQCLSKNYDHDTIVSLTLTGSVLWQHILTGCACVCVFLCVCACVCVCVQFTAYEILIVSTYYKLCISWNSKVFNPQCLLNHNVKLSMKQSKHNCISYSLYVRQLSAATCFGYHAPVYSKSTSSPGSELHASKINSEYQWRTEGGFNSHYRNSEGLPKS